VISACTGDEVIVISITKYNIAPLNARESADVADEYYRSATIGNSRRNARSEVGQRSGAVAGDNGSLAESFEWNQTCSERTELIIE